MASSVFQTLSVLACDEARPAATIDLPARGGIAMFERPSLSITLLRCLLGTLPCEHLMTAELMIIFGVVREENAASIIEEVVESLS